MGIFKANNSDMELFTSLPTGGYSYGKEFATDESKFFPLRVVSSLNLQNFQILGRQLVF